MLKTPVCIPEYASRPVASQNVPVARHTIIVRIMIRVETAYKEDCQITGVPTAKRVNTTQLNRQTQADILNTADQLPVEWSMHPAM